MPLLIIKDIRQSILYIPSTFEWPRNCISSGLVWLSVLCWCAHTNTTRRFITEWKQHSFIAPLSCFSEAVSPFSAEQCKLTAYQAGLAKTFTTYPRKQTYQRWVISVSHRTSNGYHRNSESFKLAAPIDASENKYVEKVTVPARTCVSADGVGVSCALVQRITRRTQTQIK